jgi:hypothetical protein
MYLYLFADDNFGISIKREQIFGLAADGKEFAALSPDEAADRAGGLDSLLAALSDESEIKHVAKRAGLTFGEFSVGGLALGCRVGTLLFCAAGGALGVASGLVGAAGVATYLTVSEHARKITMLEDVMLPAAALGKPLQGYVFLPLGEYRTLRIVVSDPQTGSAQEIEIVVAPGTLKSPGQVPTRIAETTHSVH